MGKSVVQGQIQKGGSYDGRKGHTPARYIGGDQKTWSTGRNDTAGSPKKWGSEGKGANGRGMPTKG